MPFTFNRAGKVEGNISDEIIDGLFIIPII
jgi:hypothetical protein